METSSQEDIEPEESIYSGGFTSPKDQALFPKFHTGDWKEKFEFIDKFEDERLVTLATVLYLMRHLKFYHQIYIKILKVVSLQEY